MEDLPYLENFEKIGIGYSIWDSYSTELRISKMTFKYISSAKLLDELKINVKLICLGFVSFKVEGKIFKFNGNKDDNELLTEGLLEFVIVDKAKEKSTKVPGPIKKILEGCVNNEEK